MASFSETLVERVRNSKRTSISIDAGRRELVIANLMFLHDAVVASEQLLSEAADQADRLPACDYHRVLSRYYRTHLDEERGHVSWLRADLESAGIRVGHADKIAMAMVGTQYYLIKHVHPAALLGYMAVVEGDPVPEKVVDLLERAHGKELLRFIRFHALADLEHRRELFELIDRAPEPVQNLIASSADDTLAYFSQAATTWKSLSARMRCAPGAAHQRSIRSVI
jgi:hypothetical protein